MTNPPNLVASWALATLVLLPLAGGLLLLSVRRIGERLAAELGTAAAAATLVIAVLAAVTAAPFGRTAPGLDLDVSWIPALGVRMHLGLDGISAPLVVLTALLGLLVCWHVLRIRPPAGRIQGLVACFLFVEAGAIGTFLALDLVVFFVAFETVLVPMWFVIARWGDDEQPVDAPIGATPIPGGEAARRDAANRFILYTALGSAVMLLGLLLIALRSGTTDLVALAYRGGAGMSVTVQTIAAGLVVIGLAVKAPMFPFHTWLPPAHTIAPTGGSVLLAGVLLKMGTYGLVRVVVPVVPAGLHRIAPILGALGVAGILWGGLACFVTRDLKRLIALSSVAHMGFVLLGVASMTPEGLQGALFANVAHGLITGLLFLVVGAIKDRHHTADLRLLGSGLRDRLPRLGWLLAFGAIAGLGLPGLAGFWGEVLAIAGAWQPGSAMGGASRPLAVLAAIGTAVAAAYLLRMLRSLWHGPAPVADPNAIMSGPIMGDVSTHEVAVLAPLVVLTVALGVVPGILLGVTAGAVRLLLTGGTP